MCDHAIQFTEVQVPYLHASSQDKKDITVCMYVCMYGCMDVWMDGWMDGGVRVRACMDGLVYSLSLTTWLKYFDRDS